MPRSQTRKMIVIFLLMCTVCLILQKHLSDKFDTLLTATGNNDFGFKNMYTRFWRFPELNTESPKNEGTMDIYDQDYFLINIKSNNVKKKSTIIKTSSVLNYSLLPWFIKGGQIRPQKANGNSTPILWPEQSEGDRIIQQLMYVPSNYSITYTLDENRTYFKRKIKLKKILVYFGVRGFYGLPRGRRRFLKDKCPVDTCTIVTSHKDAKTCDAILFQDRFEFPYSTRRKPDQLWILYLLENPLHTPSFKKLEHVINWTATYRHDSDIVTPYEKFVPYSIVNNLSTSEKFIFPENLNYAAGKTKMIAAIISNCDAKNQRLQYAYILGHYTDVDIYGACGKYVCPRNWHYECLAMIEKDYKFYLAFENSNCKDYITEKFFINGLSRNVIPIVMGARREDYARVAPPHSYIHVDDFASPIELATYLKMLDANDTMYNEYFAWKGSGEFVNTYFWCRLCALLHAPYVHKSYADLHDWWNKPGTCDSRKEKDVRQIYFIPGI